jgi:cyclase
VLRPRIIPCLLVRNGALVKTVQFGSSKYVGDPINAVRIFNEKEVDELVVLDIDATVQQREPDYRLIQSLAAECRMPLCYGGGVKTVEQIERIVALGVEKIAISSAAVQDRRLLLAAGERVGRQSIVVVIDAKKSSLIRKYEVRTHNGTRKTGLDPAQYAADVAELAGEARSSSMRSTGTAS